MNILGISAYYHDSAACLVKDGTIVAAAQEERFSREKHDARFPGRAVEFCLEAGAIGAEDVDFIAFYEKPLLKFDRILETYLAYAPRGFGVFRRGLPVWLKQKLHLRRELARGVGGRFGGRLVFPEHHESHAASAFFPSPFEEAAILTLDGVGEWATATIGRGAGNRIELMREIRFPHSLGLLYSAFTSFCGFRVNSGEYKLMGLAPYGDPIYRDVFLDRLIDLKDDGSFRVDPSYFPYGWKSTMTSRKLERLVGGRPRRPESEITKREMDIAASIQSVTEEVMLRSARFAHALTGSLRLVLAGGVALNCVGNGRIRREGPFEEIWIQPAAGDAGGALGAALFVWHQLLERERSVGGQDSQRGSLLGPEFGRDEVRTTLESLGATYTDFDGDEHRLVGEIVQLIASENVVGHFAGRMEFGPRALGNRSILGDARSPRMQGLLNEKIKFRESFRPFAPSVLREDAASYFDLRGGDESPYMLVVAPVHASRRLPPREGGRSVGFERLREIRTEIPAVTHVDDSARVQTVDRTRNSRYHLILQRLKQVTGCPVVVNTSMNVRGQPIVCTPAEAYRCFMATQMDALVIEDVLLLKSEQGAEATRPLEPHSPSRGRGSLRA